VPVELRDGRTSDAAAILDLWDGAIAWLVARGQVGQWGSEPVSARPQTREMVDRWVAAPGVTIAERDREAVGVSVIAGSCPEYVPPTARRETYLTFLLSSRRHGGQGIGSLLVRGAAADARAAGSEVLRVDCWAGAPTLVAWYERQGFVRSTTFVLRGWHGQVFEMALNDLTEA
jgi:GNAT superfamily N-acetyltransferase